MGRRLTWKAAHPAAFQAGPLALRLNGETVDVDVDLGAAASLPGPVLNVACTYAALRDDILNGTRTVADPVHAVRLARLVDTVLTSATDGPTAMSSD